MKAILAKRWVAMCVILALVLRLFRIGHQSFHIDEIISIDSATYAQGFVFWKGLLHEIHGPFTSALLHLWLHLGRSETWMRFLYALPAAFAVPLFHRLGRRLLDETTGRVACLAVAVSPFQVWYGQEVRNYAWLLLFTTATLLVFTRIWDGPARRRDWVALTTLLSLCLLTNYSAVFLLISMTVMFLARRDRRLIRAWALTALVSSLVFLPWFLDWYQRIGGERLFLDRPRQFDVPLRAMTGFSPTFVPYLIWVFTFGYSLGPTLFELHVDRSLRSILAYWPVLSVGVFAIGAAGVLGVREIVRRGRAGLFSGLLLVPLTLAIILTLRDIKAFNVRYVMVAYPMFIVLLAAGWRRPGRLGAAAGAAALVLTVLSLSNHYFDSRYAKEDMRAAADLVLRKEQPGDSIVVVDNNQAFRYYFTTGSGVARLFHLHKRFLRTDEDLRDHFRSAIRPGERTWLVLSRWWEVGPKDGIYAVMDDLLRRREHWAFSGVEITLYEPPGATASRGGE